MAGPMAHSSPSVQPLELSAKVSSNNTEVVHEGFVQVPFEQTSLLEHAAPQAPQLAGSRLVSAHLPLHFVVPPRHVTPHTPMEQTWPAEHGFPHAPQCAGSRSVS